MRRLRLQIRNGKLSFTGVDHLQQPHWIARRRTTKSKTNTVDGMLAWDSYLGVGFGRRDIY
uniref:Uncharacterized protein n=1 Tax=Utricularia reniformis TaxID=192314 RepID=A0A1Y0AZ28_9LAMI|nr:hypothetical protein AEK19_MT2038 [Utricularia reniformis]ART30426.1 hypothetical protein AEK19_MT2038 [Utricularia reniformis]